MNDTKKRAFLLIILLGFVSLFSDMVYEGARSVNGPFLKTVGAGAIAVGIVTGLGEFLGYAVRLLSGSYADKTRAYWVFIIVGYALLAAVPLLSLTGTWQIVAILVILERVGKGVRSPAKDALLSRATKNVGTGFGFGIHEAMDQIGAVLGPLIFTVVLALDPNGTVRDYQHGYSLLWIPFALAMASIVAARILFPKPETVGTETITPNAPAEPLSRTFWLYTIFAFFLVSGFAGFSLLAYHFKATGLVPDAQIPLLYAIAMGVDGSIAVFVGRLYDRIGLKVLYAIPLLTIPIAFLGFSSIHGLMILAVILWGVVMGIHETVVKAAIADLTPIGKRGTGYGVFNTVSGLAALVGGTAIGFLYDRSILAVMIFCAAAELMSIPLLILIGRETKRRKPA
jgi:MFS family permease